MVIFVKQKCCFINFCSLDIFFIKKRRVADLLLFLSESLILGDVVILVILVGI